MPEKNNGDEVAKHRAFGFKIMAATLIFVIAALLSIGFVLGYLAGKL